MLSPLNESGRISRTDIFLRGLTEDEGEEVGVVVPDDGGDEVVGMDVPVAGGDEAISVVE